MFIISYYEKKFGDLYIRKEWDMDLCVSSILIQVTLLYFLIQWFLHKGKILGLVVVVMGCRALLGIIFAGTFLQNFFFFSTFL